MINSTKRIDNMPLWVRFVAVGITFVLAVWIIGFVWDRAFGIGPDYFYHYRQAPLDYFQGKTRLYDNNTKSLPLLPWAVFILGPTLTLPIIYGQAVIIVVTLISLLWLIVAINDSTEEKLPLYAVILSMINLFTVDLLIRGNYEGFLAMGLAMAWVGYKKERPLLTGLGVAIFITKPINMILPGLFFAVITLRRGIRASILTALPTIVLLILSFPLFGWDWMLRYVTYTTAVETTYTSLSFDNTALYLQTALWRMFEFWGFPPRLGIIVSIIGQGITALYIVTRIKGTSRALIITLCAALTFGIYVHGNHYVLLAPALAGLIAINWRYSLIWLLTLSPLLRQILNRFDVAWTDSLFAIVLLVIWTVIVIREHKEDKNNAQPPNSEFK